MTGAKVATAQELGMDPGMMLDSALQTRRGIRFSLQQAAAQAVGERNYQLIAVAEQGTLQDSRPFEIIDSTGFGKQDYQTASTTNVSPFFFEWNHSQGRLSASLEIDTASNAYFYRNRAGLDTTPSSPEQRDQARTIYREIPANIGAPGLPQLKNSLDDFVHMAFFEQDAASATEFLNGLDSLSYSISLRAGRTDLDHPFNYQQSVPGDRQLKSRTGSRVVASIHWSEDRDQNGVHEVYLIEINLGGSSSNPAWQTGQRCAQDLETHTSVISGQYMVLGGEYWLAAQGLPLSANQLQSLTINWGRILRQLASGGPGSDCKLNGTLQPVPNTLGLGVAIEARGGVLQTLDIAGATAHREHTLPETASVALAEPATQDSDGAVQVQFSTPVSSSVASPEDAEPVPLPASTFNNLQPFIDGLEIHLPLADSSAEGVQQTWWQIQSADDWSPRCNNINEIAIDTAITGELRCQVLPGLYTVIEHISGNRWDNLLVSASAGNPESAVNAAAQLDGLVFDVTNRTLTWSQPGWYQVQRESDYASVCESSGFCELEPGIYQIVNHHTGQKWRNFVVPGG